MCSHWILSQVDFQSNFDELSWTIDVGKYLIKTLEEITSKFAQYNQVTHMFYDFFITKIK